jgi:hypothetical protein
MRCSNSGARNIVRIVRGSTSEKSRAEFVGGASPGGAFENSPALQRRESGKTRISPGGAAEFRVRFVLLQMNRRLRKLRPL